MNTREAIKLGLAWGDMVCNSYLQDLTDAELLVRPIPNTNHIAWQLGHLIRSERDMVEAIRPGNGPALPAGFVELHNNETATSDDPSKFLKKSEYQTAAVSVRQAALKTLDQVSDAELDLPAPAPWSEYTKSIGDLFALMGAHWLMHAGQWAIVRRKLGRPPLF